MPSRRFAEALKLATDLPEEERAALAEELWGTVPETLSPAWEHELRDRIAEMKAARARGEPAGLALGFDEMMTLVRKPEGNDDDDE